MNTRKKIILAMLVSMILLLTAYISLYSQDDEIGHLIDQYTKDLKSPHKTVRLKAVKGLSRILDRRIVNPLISALHDKNKFVRKEACHGLGILKHTRAVEPLGILLIEEKESYVRLECAWALGNMGFTKALCYLHKQLKCEKKLAVKNEIKKAIARLEG